MSAMHKAMKATQVERVQPLMVSTVKLSSCILPCNPAGQQFNQRWAELQKLFTEFKILFLLSPKQLRTMCFLLNRQDCDLALR